MSRVLDVQDKLRENTALIARLEKDLVAHQSKEIAASLRSLYKLHHVYEEQFREAADVESMDVVSYRLFKEHDRFTVALVGKAMDLFQNLYSILYYVVSTGKPRDTAHLSSDVITGSALEFAYAKSGSVDLVFTMPNERLLFGETQLDEAMADFFAMARASDIDQVKAFAKQFGLAPVRALYKWAHVLSGSSVGADVQWRKSDALKGHLLLQPAEITALETLIGMTSDLEVDENDITGTLHGFDDKNYTFRFEPSDGGSMLHGTVGSSAELPPQVKIPESYIARVKTTTRVHYATDYPETNHELLGLFDRH
jgi:hypothetical protein